MVHVLFIGKYPPIQGGTATAAYWRNKELQKQDMSFEVITCIPANNEYLTDYAIKNDHEHLLCEKTAWHIPYSQLFSEQLVSKALEIAEQQQVDVVEGNYLFPYGFAAYVVSKIINKPLILRHAGSDLYRISDHSMFTMLLKEMALHAKVIVTNRESEGKWKRICDRARTIVSGRYVPDPAYFNDGGAHEEAAFLGKVTEKWNRKQLEYYYKYLVENRYSGKIRVYSNKSAIDVFNDYFSPRGYLVEGHPFVVPEKVPEILRDVKYLLVSQIPDGIPEESNIYMEGVAAGCVPVCEINKNITSEDMDFSKYIKTQRIIYKEALN